MARNPSSPLYIDPLDMGFFGPKNINQGGPYKRPASKNEGIFGGGLLIRPASANRF